METSPANHIAIARLFDLAEGLGEILAVEREHLHGCNRCQLVLKSFVTHSIENPPEAPEKASRQPAA